MKKGMQRIVKLAIGLIILAGSLVALAVSAQSYRQLMADDVENISRLSSSIIKAEIDGSLTKPIHVGQTMANDAFLKDWLQAESPEGNNPAQTDVISQYLQDYHDEFGYDSVFLVSAKSSVYYYYDGVNKTISRENDFDSWYYDFVDTNSAYELKVDFDETNSRALTIFANCRVQAADGTLLGVVGVGMEISHLQELLRGYEKDYELRAFLIDAQGNVQIDASRADIEKVSFFENPVVAPMREQILQNKESMQLLWYPDKDTENCLLTQYVKNLGWYLVIEKNTQPLQTLLRKQLHWDLLLAGIVILVVLMLVSRLLTHYNRLLLKTACLDEVTNLPNVKMFEQIFKRNRRRPACNQGLLFLYDVDDFKDVNDRFGHLYGNTVLYKVSEAAKRLIGSNGLVARWGGDEFIGVVYGDEAQTLAVLEQMKTGILQLDEALQTNVTISIGAAKITAEKTLEQLITQADAAMYEAKQDGKNKLVRKD